MTSHVYVRGSRPAQRQIGVILARQGIPSLESSLLLGQCVFFTCSPMFIVSSTTSLRVRSRLKLTNCAVYSIPFFLLSILPLISWRQRLAAGVMFGAGFAVVVLSSTYLLSAVVNQLQEGVMWRFWAVLHELTLAIAVPCLPALRLSAAKWWRYHKQNSEDLDHDREPRGVTEYAGRNNWNRKGSFMRSIRRGYLETNEVADCEDEGEMKVKRSITSMSSRHKDQRIEV